MIDDALIARMIYALLDARAATASICPSEVARALAPEAWRPLMPRIRDVARLLADAGRLQLTQRGRPLAPDTVPRGPIRLSHPPDPAQ